MSDGEYKPSELAQGVKPGRYRHFKGGDYEVLSTARSSEDREQEFVIYRSIKNGTTWVRPLAMFVEHVEKPEYNYSGPRFQYVGE